MSDPAPEIHCPVTGESAWRFLARFDAPPPVETDFGIADYRRELWQGERTGHVVNHHAMDLSQLYAGDYWDRTYGVDGVRRQFERIMALPPERSDNRGRVAYADAEARRLAPEAPRTLLDVGAGLAVFPAAMREAGWSATALDPDPRAADHAESVAGVEALTGTFGATRIDRRFGLVSFNKVLEHVPDPVPILASACDVLVPGGLVYIELPDAEGALADPDGPAREEFAIEHYCAFSAVSFAMLVRGAGLRLRTLERLVEPSGKYTLRGFADCAAEAAGGSIPATDAEGA